MILNIIESISAVIYRLYTTPVIQVVHKCKNEIDNCALDTHIVVKDGSFRHLHDVPMRGEKGSLEQSVISCKCTYPTASKRSTCICISRWRFCELLQHYAVLEWIMCIVWGVPNATEELQGATKSTKAFLRKLSLLSEYLY